MEASEIILLRPNVDYWECLEIEEFALPYNQTHMHVVKRRIKRNMGSISNARLKPNATTSQRKSLAQWSDALFVTPEARVRIDQGTFFDKPANEASSHTLS
ncbi:hypothetical protein VNO77_22725 [Canavalia gladiata]|uniref:Uncharacterized protein n=1 Tax=Canavalia gladiata TaxID=3824 RepID=A0AAN9L5Q7_CANGL